tara:strand:+ start:13416 stop:13859 length:444 start_codon:yes stop_codon:yes gene_type:complete
MIKKIHHYGNWTSKQELNPDNAFGFVYKITNTNNGRMYIGKRQYHRWRKGKKLGPTKWQSYTGSSGELSTDMKGAGKKAFTFEVLEQYNTRGWLVYGEANYQHKLDVLTAYMDDGITRQFYNKQIGAIRYVPKQFDDPSPVPRKKKT